MVVAHIAQKKLTYPRLAKRFLARSAFPAIAFSAASFAVWLVGQLTLRIAPAPPVPHRWPDHPLLDAFARWDTGWYFHIAEQGYFYDGPGVQSAVAFFPGYPFLVRIVGLLTGDLIVAGVLVTLIAGLMATLMLHGWTKLAFDARTARLAVVLLLVSPFAYFLLGAVFSDAMFLAAALAASWPWRGIVRTWRPWPESLRRPPGR